MNCKPSEHPEFLRIEGWLTPDEADALYLAAQAVPRGSKIVEIGSYKGRSTYALAMGAQLVDGTVYAIDTFMGSPGEAEFHDRDFYDVFKANLSKFIGSGTVKPLRMSSGGGLVALENVAPHLVFVDGSHVYEDVLFDLLSWWGRLAPGGMMVVHDLLDGRFRVREAVNMLITRSGDTVERYWSLAPAPSIAWVAKKG